MKIGIIQDRIGKESYSTKWSEFLIKYGHQYQEVSLNPSLLGEFSKFDGIMWRFAHNPLQKRLYNILSNYIEKVLNKPIYPDSFSAWHFDEKIAQHYLFERSNFPCVKSYLFLSYKEAIEWIFKNESYPIIYKLSTGAGSANVRMIMNMDEAKQVAFQMFFEDVYPYSFNEFERKVNIIDKLQDTLRYFIKGIPRLNLMHYNIEIGYLYFQKFLPNNFFNTRITIIGKRAFGFRRFNRENDFRASGSGKIDYNPENIDIRCVRVAFGFSDAHSFKCMAYDFLLNENGLPEICEISYTFSDWIIYECPGYWDSDFKWHDGRMWPEEAQVLDFIERVDEAYS